MPYNKIPTENDVTDLDEDFFDDLQDNIGDAFDEKCSYVTTSGSSSTTSSSLEPIEACSLTLNKGIYLILGSNDSTVSSTTDIINSKFILSSATLLSGTSSYRGIMNSGGGLTSWIIVSIASSGTVKIENYVKNTYTIRSTMTAIKLQ